MSQYIAEQFLPFKKRKAREWAYHYVTNQSPHDRVKPDRLESTNEEQFPVKKEQDRFLNERNDVNSDIKIENLGKTMKRREEDEKNDEPPEGAQEEVEEEDDQEEEVEEEEEEEEEPNLKRRREPLNTAGHQSATTVATVQKKKLKNLDLTFQFHSGCDLCVIKDSVALGSLPPSNCKVPGDLPKRNVSMYPDLESSQFNQEELEKVRSHLQISAHYFIEPKSLTYKCCNPDYKVPKIQFIDMENIVIQAIAHSGDWKLVNDYFTGDKRIPELNGPMAFRTVFFSLFDSDDLAKTKNWRTSKKAPLPLFKEFDLRWNQASFKMARGSSKSNIFKLQTNLVSVICAEYRKRLDRVFEKLNSNDQKVKAILQDNRTDILKLTAQEIQISKQELDALEEEKHVNLRERTRVGYR